MKIAYLILAHNTPNHMKRLIRTLDSPNSQFYIHIDKKSDIASFLVEAPNVTFLQDRSPVFWGDFSDVCATLKLIRTALPRRPDYLCLLSGSCYPLRSPQYIDAFFERASGREFINLVPIPHEPLGKPLSRVQDYWLKTPHVHPVLTKIVQRGNLALRRLGVKRDHRPVFGHLKPYAGSQWWALTCNACNEIVEFTNSHPKLLKFFQNVYMPDEAFIQTAIGNLPFAHNISHNVTFADWSRPGGGPALIDMDHLNAFVKSKCIIGDDAYGRGELLFARKFPDDSLHLTDFIDAYLIKRG